MAPQSGLSIRIGRIEGSIWSDTKLRDVRLYDPQGLFAESPLIEVDWQPLGWITNRLSSTASTPSSPPSTGCRSSGRATKPGPVLPGFDIHIGRLDDRPAPDRQGGDRQRRASPASPARRHPLRAGAGRPRGGGEGRRRPARAALDAEPDRDRFDLDVRLDLAGERRRRGDARHRAADRAGRRGRRQLGGVERHRPARPFAAAAPPTCGCARAKGRYSLAGRLAPAQFWKGKKAAADRAAVAGQRPRDARGPPARRPAVAALAGDEASTAPACSTSPAAAFATCASAPTCCARRAMFPNMTGQKVRLTALLNGPFRTGAFAYRLTTPRVAFDNTGFEDVWARGPRPLLEGAGDGADPAHSRGG